MVAFFCSCSWSGLKLYTIFPSIFASTKTLETHKRTVNDADIKSANESLQLALENRIEKYLVNHIANENVRD